MADPYAGFTPMSDRDRRRLAGLVTTEVPPLKSYPDERQKMLDGVVENVLNRSVSPEFGLTNSVTDVGNQYNQYSAVNGPINGVAGRRPKMAGVENIASPETQSQVDKHLYNLAAGAQQTFPGNVNYLNPYASSQSNLDAWGNNVVNQGQVAGVGRAKQYYGVAPGYTPSIGTPQFDQPQMQSLARNYYGIGQGMAGPIAADSIDRVNDAGSQVYNRQQQAIQGLPPQDPGLFADAVSAAKSVPSKVAGLFSNPFSGLFGSSPPPAPAPAPSQPQPIGAPAPQSVPQPTAPEPPTAAPTGIASLGAPAPFGMPAQASMAPSPLGIGGLTSSGPAPGPQRISSAPAPFSMPQRPASAPQAQQPFGLTPTLSALEQTPWGAAPSPAPAKPAPAPSAPQSLLGGIPSPVMGNPAQSAPQLQGIQGAPTPSAPAPVNGGAPDMPNGMTAAEGARRLAAHTLAPSPVAPAPVAPQQAPAPATAAPAPMPTNVAPTPPSIPQTLQQAPTASIPGIPQSAITTGLPTNITAPAPSPVMNAPTPLNPVAPQTPANQPTYDPQQTTATPSPTTMQTVKGVGKTAAGVGKAGLAGAKVGSLFGGPVGGVIGGGLGLAGGLANVAMDHYGTNINNLFGGPISRPGSAPATANDVVANAAPSVLHQVNHMDYGPAPTGYHYGYSPFGNNISAISNNASEASQIAGTGPGILGAFGFGTSKDGYNNGPTNSPAAQQAAATQAATQDASTKASKNKTDAANSQSSTSGSSSKTSSSQGNGGGSGAGMSSDGTKKKSQ